MPVTNNADVLVDIQALVAEQKNLFRSLTTLDLAIRIRYDGLANAIQKKLMLIDVPMLQRQPDEAAAPTLAPEPTRVPAVVMEQINPMRRQLPTKGTVPVSGMALTLKAYQDLKSTLGAYIKGDDREIISINTVPEEGKLILNTFTGKQGRMLMVFTTNSAGWILTEMDNVYTVTDIKYWKMEG